MVFGFVPKNTEITQNRKYRKIKYMTLGITLSGGGARGLAHIGVLKALEEKGIQPDVISGASAGAIVGALYAAGKTPDEIFDIAKESNLFKLLKVNFMSRGFANLKYLKQVLEENIAHDNFDALTTPLYISISNLGKGEVEIRSNGKLFDVVVASCSIPIVFSPVEIDNQIYVDGGLLMNMPAQPIRDKVDVVIGVNVMPDREWSNEKFGGMFDVAVRTFNLAVLANYRQSKVLCDHILEPPELENYHMFQFNKAEEMYQLGYDLVQKEWPTIEALINKKLTANV